MRAMSPTMLAFILREKRSTNALINNNVKLQMRKQQHRLMVGRGNNRSGVHGTHLPTTDTLDNVEEVEKEINKGKRDLENKRKNIEETVDSRLGRFKQRPQSPTK